MDRYLFQFKSGGQWYLTCNIAQDPEIRNGQLYYNLISLHFEKGKVIFRWSEDVLFTHELSPGMEDTFVNIVMIVSTVDALIKLLNQEGLLCDTTALIDEKTNYAFTTLVLEMAKK